MNGGTMRMLCVAAVCAAFLGCASKPPAAEPPVPSPAGAGAAPPLSPQSAYEQMLRDRATSAMRQKRLADAAIAWELLTVLRPDAGDYREHLADVQRQVDMGVAARLPRAAQAVQRGDIENASQLYLAVLALQPLNETAAEALRGLERERNKRNYLGKFSRVTLTRRAITDAEMPAGVKVDAGGLAGRNDLEHAALLAGDGEFDDAIGLLERRLVDDRQDLAARRLLADVYYRKAEALLPRDRPAALAALEQSVRAYPSDPRAAARLRQLKRGAALPPAGAASSGQIGSKPAL